MFIRLVCFAGVSGSFDFEHQQGGLLVIKPARYQGKEERFSPPPPKKKNLKLFQRRGGVRDNPVKKTTKKKTPHTGATLSPSCWLWMCAGVFLPCVKRRVQRGSKCVLRSARHTWRARAASREKKTKKNQRWHAGLRAARAPAAPVNKSTSN